MGGNESAGTSYYFHIIYNRNLCFDLTNKDICLFLWLITSYIIKFHIKQVYPIQVRTNQRLCVIFAWKWWHKVSIYHFKYCCKSPLLPLLILHHIRQQFNLNHNPKNDCVCVCAEDLKVKIGRIQLTTKLTTRRNLMKITQ